MAAKATDKHIEFIRLVAIGTNQMEAYKATIGNGKATNATCKNKGSKLAKRYAIDIQQAKEKAAKIVEGVKDNETLKTALNEVLSQAEADAILCKTLKGEREVETLIVINGTIERVMTKPDHSDILKAYDLYNKRFGSNAPVKTDNSTINTITINGG